MTRPRSQLIVLESTPFYHCIARCVRRAFLCGKDTYSGKCFDHRKPWVIARIKCLEQAFAIDIAAYAVMSNHYHLVLHADRPRTRQWSRQEVVHRWLMLYKGPPVIQRFQQGEPLSPAELTQVDKLVSTWRERLCSISWFMACLNEYIARRANREDDCKGRFWEGRFTSRALLDEAALLSCMAYVDLNPVRAGLAKDVLSSDFTSLQQRLYASGKKPAKEDLARKPVLMPFREKLKPPTDTADIPFRLQDYIQLVQWTTDVIMQGNTQIATKALPLLSQLGVTPRQWQLLTLLVQKQSIAMIHGLNRIARIEQQSAHAA